MSCCDELLTNYVDFFVDSYPNIIVTYLSDHCDFTDLRRNLG